MISDMLVSREVASALKRRYSESDSLTDTAIMGVS